MKPLKPIIIILGVILCHLAVPVWGQTSAFTYQGLLTSSNGPANGTYDIQFTLFATNLTGNAIAGPVTNSATAVSNGLLDATVDFEPGVFTGINCWLDIAVRTNGTTPFIELTPRQRITSTPYASFANTASNLVGTIPATQVSGALQSVSASSPLLASGSQNVTISIPSYLTVPNTASLPPSPSNGQLYNNTALNRLIYYSGSSWNTVASPQTQSNSVANGSFLSLMSTFNSFPAVNVWVLSSGTSYSNVVGNSSYPIYFDSNTKIVTVYNNSGSTKTMVISAVGQ